MVIKFQIFKDRIFIAAITISIIWHVFWLSIVKVVVAPPVTGPIKFSRVSFLGPIPERSVIAARAVSKERSFLERRYLEHIGHPEVSGEPLKANTDYTDNSIMRKSDKTLTPFIEEILASSKLEPTH